jgi:hypothetical protein
MRITTNWRLKKSQGEVVATILLILLTISALAVIIAFVIPLIHDWLSDKDCYDYNGIVEIKNDGKYTCFNIDHNTLSIKVKMNDMKDKNIVPLQGFQIIVNTEGKDQERFTITKTGVTPIGMVIPNSGVGAVSIPDANEERSYNISLKLSTFGEKLKPNNTIIYPLLENGKECSTVNYVLSNIPHC